MVILQEYRNSLEKEGHKLITEALDGADVIEDLAHRAIDSIRSSAIKTLGYTDVTVDRRIPAVAAAPFLRRNHIGYKLKNADVRSCPIDIRLKALCRKRKKAKASKEEEDPKEKEEDFERRKERLDSSIVDLKRSHLLNFHYDDAIEHSPMIVVIEVFNIMNVIGCTDDLTTAFIRIVGTNEDGTVVDYVTEIHRHLTQPNIKSASSVFEFIPPKPSANLTELYLVAETRFTKVEESDRRTSMRNRTVRRSAAESASSRKASSSSSSPSVDVVAVGALKIATKDRKPDPAEGPWAVTYRTFGLTLLSGEQLGNECTPKNANRNVANLADKCRRAARTGPAPTLRIELSNESAYGAFDDEELESGQITNRLRNRNRGRKHRNAAPPSEVDITYNLEALENAEMPILIQRGLRMPVAYKMKSEKHWLLNLDSSQKKIHYAHHAGKRRYRCLFCIKQFPSMESLQFHLEQSYPSFLFEFEATRISIAVDETKLAAEPIRKRSTDGDFAMFKYRVTGPREDSYADSGVGSLDSGDIKLPRGPKKLLPFERSYLSAKGYSNCAPWPGLYGHEIGTGFMQEIFQHRFAEFTDVDDLEIEFYVMWNMFTNVERCNRTKDISRIYDKLLKFVHLSRQAITERNLGMPFLAFIATARTFRYVNEEEFMTLMSYRTQYENNYQGYEDVLAVKEEKALAKLAEPQKAKRGRKKKVVLPPPAV
uniref:C2H2-type domain-containing protein n=1 Tax=Panagrellus redivivus TaxID=6233 RepID=A0A7E4UZK5_PANRE